MKFLPLFLSEVQQVCQWEGAEGPSVCVNRMRQGTGLELLGFELWGADAIEEMDNTAPESALGFVHFHLSTLSQSSAFPRG